MGTAHVKYSSRSHKGGPSISAKTGIQPCAFCKFEIQAVLPHQQISLHVPLCHHHSIIVEEKKICPLKLTLVASTCWHVSVSTPTWSVQVHSLILHQAPRICVVREQSQIGFSTISPGGRQVLSLEEEAINPQGRRSQALMNWNLKTKYSSLTSLIWIPTKVWVPGAIANPKSLTWGTSEEGCKNIYKVQQELVNFKSSIELHATSYQPQILYLDPCITVWTSHILILLNIEG